MATNGEVFNKVFRVPVTREMVTALLDPKQKKGFFDIMVLATMAVEIGLFFLLPSGWKTGVFLGLFMFWRVAYNVGLGALLKYQSDQRGLVSLAKKYKLFQPGHPWYGWLKRELSLKMGEDYDFASAPIEYNTWLLYRQLVDLILMNDFTTYICFALSCFKVSPQSSVFLFDILRWSGGLFLVGFNIWVKIDAQRVVKDFAWYWGDFFFLIEQSLTFDGVFEMAPHPMYSVGYIGYYGVSLMCASYTVLFVSMAAHALQFAFLAFVETPHIEKTYNPPAIFKRQPKHTVQSEEETDQLKRALESHHRGSYLHNTTYFRRDLTVFKNFDLCRSTDLIFVVVLFYSVLTPLLVGGTTFAVSQAIFWRLFHSYGLGALLRAQSREKYFTRHFVKWGGDVQEAFQNWKSIYNFSLCMTYVSFFMACWKMYSLPSDWTYGTTLLRHTLGLVFISLHIWTSASIYETLGDFGWFYGDFFIDEQPTTLLYTGIYRFLNNPEKIMGHIAFWGMTLVANSWTMFGLALFSQLSNVLFLHYVEAPHMRTLYGDQIRKEAGLTKTLKNAIPKAVPETLSQEVAKLIRDQAVERIVKEATEKIEKTMEETAGAVGDMMDATRPRLQKLLDETKSFLETSRTRVIPRVANNLETYDLTRYNLSIAGGTKTKDGMKTFKLGEGLVIDWEAPEYHGPRDWIGVYKVSSNQSTQITQISSRGLWQWTNAQDKDGVLVFPPEIETKTSGQVVFKGSKLPWEIGIYEFRYHHDGKHNVMTRSDPFEIVAPTVRPSRDVDVVERSILKLVQDALGNDSEVMPVSPVEDYLGMTEKEAKHVVYGIKLMFGVEFAWEVVLADKCVARLAKRIHLALDALSPFADHHVEKTQSSTCTIPPSMRVDGC
ncbi:phosphatidylethanolamine N-methyltransferase [Apophysomyces ossiformis]|uniref:Phosphatidylethanolamine N-methyltransferase n=1 Tax=Apophysomyces ossiformis TaxID=679940 RepID=A0A8H7BWX3_9FUNG|nr:phosphatidylethanolamine N-methyltransferase [Apophysomyces ossiformis]